MRGEQHADVPGQSRQDDGADLEIIEQELERGVEESGVPWLEDEVVTVIRKQALEHFGSARPVPAVIDHALPLGEPPRPKPLRLRNRSR